MAENSKEPEQPRAEPEIIPPDRRQSGWRQSSWQTTWVSRDAMGRAHGAERIYVSRMGPFGVAILLLAFAVLAAIIFLAIIGAVLIWIPVVALVVAIAAVFRFLRR